MLYLDYSREEWLPNQYGGRENLEAVQFLQETNGTLHRAHPGVWTIAEESTSWDGVTRPPTSDGGLGFDFKWNMGWMNDTLEYFKREPVHRSYHHGELTFSMVYAYSEHYILPFSHDEVVHGKGTIWGRQPGDDWNKAAGVRALYAYMYSHPPGKNLLFMGQEFGQTTEWNESSSVDWSNLEGWGGHEWHQGIKKLSRDLGALYKNTPALYTRDFDPSGFHWVVGDDANGSVLAYERYGEDGPRCSRSSTSPVPPTLITSSTPPPVRAAGSSSSTRMTPATRARATTCPPSSPRATTVPGCTCPPTRRSGTSTAASSSSLALRLNDHNVRIRSRKSNFFRLIRALWSFSDRRITSPRARARARQSRRG